MFFSKKLLTICIWIVLGRSLFPEVAYSAVSTGELDKIDCSFTLDTQHPHAGENFSVTLVCDHKPDPYTTDLKCAGLDIVSISHNTSPNKYVYTYHLHARKAGTYDIALNLSFCNVPYPITPIHLTVGQANTPWVAIAVVILPLLLYLYSRIHVYRNRKKKLPEYALKTGRIRIRSVKAICHYFIIPIVLLSIPFLTGMYMLITHFRNNPLVPNTLIIGLMVVPSCLAVMTAIMLYRKLYFKKIPTKLSVTEIYKIITELGAREQWTCTHSGTDYYACRTNPEKRQSVLGEQIFIVFDQRRIWVNSICDPHKFSFGSMFGRTKRNIRLIRRGIRKWGG
jgi:hypothetical protein